jgi:hypothetical protein
VLGSEDGLQAYVYLEISNLLIRITTGSAYDFKLLTSADPVSSASPHLYDYSIVKEKAASVGERIRSVRNIVPSRSFPLLTDVPGSKLRRTALPRLLRKHMPITVSARWARPQVTLKVK